MKKLEEESNPVFNNADEDYVLPRPLVSGDSVLVADINKKAVVEELSRDGKKAFISIGGIKTWVKIKNLRLDEAPKKEKQTNKTRTISGVKSNLERDICYEIDIRGMSADEGVMETDRFIDQAILSGIETVTIIHGKGTGVLRKAIHEFLRHHKAVKYFRLGVFGEGEAGVTIAELK